MLAKRRDRSGKTDGDRAVEKADIDSELERIRRGHAEELALDQATFDLAALLRRVPRAVWGEPARRRDVQALRGEAVDELGGLAALGEADRPQPARRQLGEESCGISERARAEPELGVEERWVPDHDLAFRARRGVLIDDRRGFTDQLERELAGIGDRRRREQKLRLRVVDPRESS